MDWRTSRGLGRFEGCDMVIKLQTPVLQTQDFNCGDACVETVVKFYGIRTNVGVLRLSCPVSGLSPDSIESLLRKAGLSILSGTMTVADLKHLTSEGRPVLCPITTPEGGHWVVVLGVERGRVIYHDPSDGRASQKVADWEANWTDESRWGNPYVRWGICAYLLN